MAELLEVKGLYFGYGREPFLKNINLSLCQGELISVIGENGSGKSTLIKALTGLEAGYRGRVLYKGRDISQMSPRERAKETAVIYQGGSHSFPFSCFEVVAMGLYPHRGRLSPITAEETARIKEIMALTDTIDLAEKNITEISGGQLQRVLIARALVQKPRLLYMDEAMSGLDISAEIKIFKLIADLCRSSGLTAVNVIHDINMAFEKSDRIIAMKNGEVYAFDTPRALLNKDFFREVFQVEVEIDSSGYFRFTS